MFVVFSEKKNGLDKISSKIFIFQIKNVELRENPVEAATVFGAAGRNKTTCDDAR